MSQLADATRPTTPVGDVPADDEAYDEALAAVANAIHAAICETSHPLRPEPHEWTCDVAASAAMQALSPHNGEIGSPP